MQDKKPTIRIKKNNNYNVENKIISPSEESVDISNIVDLLGKNLDLMTEDDYKKISMILKRYEEKTIQSPSPVSNPNAKKIITPLDLVVSLKSIKGEQDILERRLKNLDKNDLIEYLESFIKLNGHNHLVLKADYKAAMEYKFENSKGRTQRLYYKLEKKHISNSKMESYIFALENDYYIEGDYGGWYGESYLRFKDTGNPNNLEISLTNKFFRNPKELAISFINLMNLILENKGEVQIVLP